MRNSLRWLAWVCLSLMMWTAVAESSHNHPNQAESSACSLCVVAHSAAPVLSSHITQPVFAEVGLLQDEEVVAPARISFFELGIRGPPLA